MILKRIEAYGFKSFADKIEFKFEHAITAIVGPNGSGKSNVADALRWVLGEQNVRNLRGAKMEDLIFNGSSSRKAVNIADVSLILDNSARIFPIEFNEVAITRRMYRSGESEYYINKTACRLKDIYELLSGTGIGKDSMSIIGQNKADEILNYKPEERRVIFEEAAGIGKYKTRKKEAERKLADTDANITRIDDITEETSCNLDALAQSATRTTRHNEASRQLCGLRLDSLALRLDKLNAAKTHCKEQEQLLNDEIIKSDTNINLMEITQLEANTSLNELNDAMSRIEAGINELNISAQTITGKVELENSHIDAASRRVQAIDEEITRLNLEIQAVSEERINNQTAIENVREQQESAQNKLNKTIAELDVVKREVSDAEQRIAAIRNDAFQKVQQTSHVKNELRACVMERENIRKSRSRFTEDSQQMQRELAKERALYEQCKAACMASNLEVHALSEQLSKLDAGVAEGKSKLEQYNTLHNRIVSNTQRMQVRLNSLMHLAQTHEGFSRATKAVLAGTFHWNRAVYGAIGELIDTEEYYALAIETALGSAAQNIVCKDDETARLAIAYLKEAKIGRVTFLPLANLRNTRYQTSTGLPDGIIGRASELVTYDKAYEQAVEMLLGRILIARDYDTARRAARELNYSSRIVTLEGEVIAPGGAITGGSNHRTGTGVVTRNAEIAALENDLNEFAEKMHNNEIAINNEQHALHNLVQQQTQSLNMHNAKKVHLSECQYLYTQSEQKVAALANACQLGEQEAAQIEQSDEEKTEQIIALEAKLKECEREEHGLQQLIEQRTIEYDQRKSGAEHMRERYNSDYIEYNDLKSKLDSAHEKLRIINKNELYYTQALDRNNREVSEQQAQIYKARQSISNLNAELRDIKQRRSEKSISLQNNFYEKNVLLEKLALLDKDLRGLRRRMQDVQSKLSDVKVLAERYRAEIQGMCERVLSDYGVVLAEYVATRTEISATEQQSIRDLEQQLVELGVVNPNAIEEHRQAQERYEFLTSQRNDLRDAELKLRAIIAELDSVMAEQFTEAVQEIGKYFSEIFVRLFGGGAASLAFTQPENMLETGVDVIVQIPGKRRQNMTLLSGGERALTVVALMFAMLQHRPSPFCVLDELDAALDESNVERFAEFLREYRERTQFVIITHRKRTMEAAECLHGITMEESGVSQLVSVKFEDTVA